MNWENRPSQASDFDSEGIKGVSVSRDYRLAHPELIKRFIRLATAYAERNPGKTLLVTTTYRSPAEQNRLYQLGRRGNEIIDHSKVVTNCNGVTNLSDHNKCPARALDVAVMNGGKISWDEAEYYLLGALSKEFELEWGGFWMPPKFKPDYPHLYLSRDVS